MMSYLIASSAGSSALMRTSATLVAKVLTARYAAQVLLLRRSPNHPQHQNQVVPYHTTDSEAYFASRFSGTGNANGTTPTTVGLNGVGVKCINGAGHPTSCDTVTPLQYAIPQRVRQKLISASDAVALVRDGDTVCVSGFVTQVNSHDLIVYGYGYGSVSMCQAFSFYLSHARTNENTT